MRSVPLPSIVLNRGNVRIWMLGVVAVLLTGVLLEGYDLWYERSFYVSTDDAQVAGGAQEIWITANVEEGLLKDIRPGQAAVVHAGPPGRTYPGRVVEAPAGPAHSPEGDGSRNRATTVVPVKVVLDGSQEGLVVGEPAYVRIRIR